MPKKPQIAGIYKTLQAQYLPAPHGGGELSPKSNNQHAKFRQLRESFMNDITSPELRISIAENSRKRLDQQLRCGLAGIGKKFG
ncbi:hypothetical protein [Undibacterium sp.]|uniref:hypothetical protein n=1 Tax=Undibacterium sp. TaxID=1914977 RepID=UPI002B83B581|nr:hypothetical protein [Undibacterium sp.]HTD04068.1 hypothetical protein [Undibacterium sp.]